MGYFSRVFGGNKDESSSEESHELHDRGPDTSAASRSSMATPSVPMSLPSGAGNVIKAPEDTSRMYNPYSGLQNINPQAQKVFRVSQQPEFVFQEEAAVRRRGFSENIGFYTGTGYLGGAIVGGGLGLVQGAMKPRPPGLTHSRRLFLNKLLNSTGQTGRIAGNTLGCLGLLFAMSESLSAMLIDEYAPSLPPTLGTLVAGATAGAVFRSPRGPKASAITAAVGAAAAALLVAARQVVPSL